MWRAAARAMLCLSVACSAAFPAAPRHGGPAWCELASEHFTVWTDGDPARVRELIRAMERFHHVAAGVAYPSAQSSGRSLAIVLRDDRELGEVNNSGEPRAFTNTAIGPLWQPVVVLSLASSELRTLAHELTHLVSLAVIHHQPRWLAEGMAAYFESMTVDDARSTVTLGTAPRRYGRSVRLVPVRELFAWSAIASVGIEFMRYHTAWALFAFLMNEHRAELGHYLWLVDRTGDPANGTWRSQQRRAWDAAFPSLPVDQIDAALREWLYHGRHMVLEFYINPKDAPITARRLSDAEAHAVRALVLGGPTPAQTERERAEVAEALALEPTNVLAHVLRISRGEPLAVELGRSIATAHPDDWRAWWLAAHAMAGAGADPGEYDRAREQACALIAQNTALVAPPRLCPSSEASQSSR